MLCGGAIWIGGDRTGGLFAFAVLAGLGALIAHAIAGVGYLVGLVLVRWRS